MGHKDFALAQELRFFVMTKIELTNLPGTVFQFILKT